MLMLAPGVIEFCVSELNTTPRWSHIKDDCCIIRILRVAPKRYYDCYVDVYLSCAVYWLEILSIPTAVILPASDVRKLIASLYHLTSDPGFELSPQLQIAAATTSSCVKVCSDWDTSPSLCLVSLIMPSDMWVTLFINASGWTRKYYACHICSYSAMM